MGAFSDWLTANLTDPTVIDADLYQALVELDSVVDKLADADFVGFDYDQFYSTGVTSVAEALVEIGDYLAANALRQLMQVPSYGAALVDATDVFSFLCLKDGVLGISFTHLATAPVGTACVLQFMKNGATMYEVSFAVGESGPTELDLSFITVVQGDLFGIKCITASGAGGLSFSMEY